jgi:SAM-dependent methyltransferase
VAGRERLRRTFGEDAERYDRARPGYPRELFDDLASLTPIGAGCRVLEIGCGTGQATMPLAARGCEIVAVELSAELAAVARRKVPSARIDIAPFEEWALPPEPFDVVFSATAFHWLVPQVRVAKAAEALRPGGALATVATHHVAGGTEQFFVDVQECYERFDPETPPGLRLPRADDVPSDPEVLTPHFGPPSFRRYTWDQSYSTEEYIDVLLTYSGHRALEPSLREALLDCIGGLIGSRYEGRIVKRYLNELRVAYSTTASSSTSTSTPSGTNPPTK